MKTVGIIGGIGLMTTPDNNRGFWLERAFQEQGLMTEAVEVVTDFWFKTLKFPVLRVPKAIANTSSRRVSEKQGMRIVAVPNNDFPPDADVLATADVVIGTLDQLTSDVIDPPAPRR